MRFGVRVLSAEIASIRAQLVGIQICSSSEEEAEGPGFSRLF